MAGIRYNAHGLTITVNAVLVEGVTSVSLPGGQAGEAETTDSDSGGNREFVRGLVDNGQMTINMRHYPGEAGQANLRTLKTAGTVVAVVITLPASATDDITVGTISFNAFVQTFGWSLETAGDTAAEVSSQLRITGDVTEAVA